MILRSSPGPTRSGLLFVALALGAVGLQYVNNSFSAEFARYPDECTHYVTGLMVREYLASFAATPPMEFAQQFYLRYPLLGLGHWPPGFYALLASWSLVFSGSKSSLLILQALLTAGSALLLFRMVGRRWGAIAAAGAAAFFLLNPTTQWLTGGLMREPATTLLVLLAAGAFARYLSQPDWRWSTAFALAAAAAILTQETAICLALVPPLGVLFTGRWNVVRRFDFWSAAAVTAALVGPWYWFVGAYLLPGRTGSPVYRLTEVSTGTRYYDQLSYIGYLLGWPLTICAAVGLAVVLLRERRSEDLTARCRAACWCAVVVGGWSVHALVPESNEARHLAHTTPVLIFGLVGLGHEVVRRAAKTTMSRRALGAALGASAVASLATSVDLDTTRRRYGFDRIAEALLAAPELEGTAVLVSSREAGEGVLISEIAMRQPDPKFFVLRGQKALAKGGYRLRMESPEEAAEFLESVPIAAVVIDDAIPARWQLPHHEQLRKAIELTGEQWERVTLPADGVENPERIKFYRRIGEDLRPKRPITLEVRRLRRNLSWEPGGGDSSEAIGAGDVPKPSESPD